ncbi:hypothetical protein [Alteribacter natronophilus]|uniref:hypothetical protein n=1 Tax=Alteribacter natronophilus TaxID=2583810 RepID=UPI00110D68EB|nr:hypothetical protein [Alteribacter natronophilus]TMW71162.1 hypothetical protein FGB90_14465 [Alteribacter natronophilus]
MNISWVLGFGWISLLFWFGLLAVSLVTEGIISYIFWFLFLIWSFILIARFYNFNGKPWRRVHFRGMRLYSGALGKEYSKSKEEDREISIFNCCKLFAANLGGGHPEKYESYVMELDETKGTYFASIVEKTRNDVFEDLSNQSVEELCEHLRINTKLGPHIILAKIIEEKYGVHEVGQYIAAILKKEAT